MTIQEIQKRYKIKTNDAEEIKRILKNKIKEIHPDNSADTDIKYFTKLKEDIDFIENISKKKEISIPISELTQTLAEIIKMQNQNEVAQIEKLNVKLDESVKKQVEINRGYTKISRYSLTSISAVVTFLWMFPNQVLEHPIMQRFISGEWEKEIYIESFTVIWICSLFLAAICWVHTYHNNRREKELLDQIKLESVQNRIFMCFLEENKSEKIFNKEQFVNYLIRYLNYEQRYKVSYKRKIWSEEVIQNIADIILVRAKEVEVIRNTKSNSLIECYEIIEYM